MTPDQQAAFTDRFARGVNLLVADLSEDRQAELELFTRVELPTARAFAEFVEVYVAGSYVGALSVRWLETGEGEPIFYPVSPGA